MSETRFEKLVPERRVEQVRNQLHAAIFSGTLRPGEVLREIELSTSMGVSQATVREALAKLEYLGLIVRTPNRRTEVKNLTRKELDERIAVRVPMETLACTLALKNGWREKDFEELVNKAERITTEDALADLAFHRYIWLRSSNAILLQSLLQLSSCLFGFVAVMRAFGLQDPHERLESHMKFIAALRTGRSGTIQAAIQDHLDSAYRAFHAENFPDFKTLSDRLGTPNFRKVEASQLVSLSS